MPERDPHDTLTKLQLALTEAGIMLDLTIIQTKWGPRIDWKNGLDLKLAHELTLTIEAGTEARVIRG